MRAFVLLCGLVLAAATPTSTPTATMTATPSATATSTATVTSAPTASATPADGTVSVAPNPVPLSGSSNLTGGPSITVLGSGLPAHATLWIDFVGTRPDGQGFAIHLNDHDAAQTDGSGHLRWQGPLRGTLEAGTDTIDLHLQDGLLGENDGRLVGRAALVVANPPGSGGTPGRWCITPLPCFPFSDFVASAVQGTLQFVNGTVQGGRNALLQTIAPILLQSTDWTQSAFDGLWTAAAPFVLWGAGLMSGLIALRLLLYTLLARAADAYLDLVLVLGELAALAAVFAALKGLESQLWTWSGAEAVSLSHDGLRQFGAALDHWTTIKDADIAHVVDWGVATIAAIVLTGVVGLQLVVIALTRLMIDGALLFLMVTGPLCMATFAVAHTRPLALWWTRSLLSLSLCPVLWGWLLGAETLMVGGIVTLAPGDYNGLLLHAAIGVLLIVGLNAVPAVLRRGVGLVIAGAGGVLRHEDSPLGRVVRPLLARVPLIGNL